MITEKEINEQFPIIGKVIMEENKSYEEVTKANFHRRQGALWLLEQFSNQVERVVIPKIAETKKCLHVLGEAWRGDWNNFDGRTLRDQLNEIILVIDGKLTSEEFMENNEIIEDNKYKGIFRWKD